MPHGKIVKCTNVYRWCVKLSDFEVIEIIDDSNPFRPYEESESTGIAKSFLQDCLKLLRDERELLEI